MMGSVGIVRFWMLVAGVNRFVCISSVATCTVAWLVAAEKVTVKTAVGTLVAMLEGVVFASVTTAGSSLGEQPIMKTVTKIPPIIIAIFIDEIGYNVLSIYLFPKYA